MDETWNLWISRSKLMIRVDPDGWVNPVCPKPFLIDVKLGPHGM